MGRIECELVVLRAGAERCYRLERSATDPLVAAAMHAMGKTTDLEIAKLETELAASRSRIENY
jgi:hypothetical protein